MRAKSLISMRKVGFLRGKPRIQVLHKITIDDDEVHAFFKRLSLHTHRLQRLSVYSYDEVKYLGGFIFEVLAAWGGVSGYLETDPIARTIEEI
jgi:hypothetical protein